MESIESRAAVRFFTLADARYYPGLVALVNSLRLLGHDEPITVLDLGFEPEQRESLLHECDLVAPPPLSPRHPWLLESQVCLTRDADVVVYIDADVIVTESLDDVVAAARDGRVSAFTDVDPTRRFAEWSELFGLAAPLRSQPYVNAGFLALSTVHFPELLPRWAECCERLVGMPTHLDTGSFDFPTALSSQDALNAILMSEISADRLDIEPVTRVAQGEGELHDTRVDDVERLRCTRDGRPVALLHAWGSPKPWAADAPNGHWRNAYLTCLRRLVAGSDLAVRAPDHRLPPWLRPDARGRVSFWLRTQGTRAVRGSWERGKTLVADGDGATAAMSRDRWKRWGVAVTPPILLPTVRRLLRRPRPESVPEWEHVPEGWSRRRDDLRGWDDPSVLEAYRTKLDDYRATLAGTGPLAYDSSAEINLGTPTVATQDVALTFGYALLHAALAPSSRERVRLSVLDWGGGLGAYGFLARAMLPPHVELDYHCKEVPRIAGYGREAVPEITFWDDERCLERTYDLVFVSSSLQYEEDWKPALGRLADASTDALLVTRIQVVHDHPSFVVLQRAYDYRFETEYLGWVFNRDELVATATDRGMALAREFVIGYSPEVVGAPERDEQRGFLFRRRSG